MTNRPTFPRTATPFTPPESGLGALLSGTMIQASQAAHDRYVELYGDPVTHLADRVDVHNLVRSKIDPSAPLTAVQVVATELVELGIALLRAQPGQERTVCGLAIGRIAALGSGFPAPAQDKPAPETAPLVEAKAPPAPPVPPTLPKPPSDIKPTFAPAKPTGTDNALTKLESALKGSATPPAEPSESAA